MQPHEITILMDQPADDADSFASHIDSIASRYGQ